MCTIYSEVPSNIFKYNEWDTDRDGRDTEGGDRGLVGHEQQRKHII